MAVTLEQIKEMNIPVGARIELTINTDINGKFEKMPENKTYSILGYFEGIHEEGEFPSIAYSSGKSSFGEMNSTYHSGYMLPVIEEIKRLEEIQIK